MNMKKFLLSALFVLCGLSANAETNDTVTVRVKGMRCEECGHKVKNALRQNPGVGALEFNYERRTVKIAYDPQKTDVDSIYRTIATTKRYKASPYDPTEKIRKACGLRIDDMHCQKCVDRIAGILNKIEGMDSISAHLDKHYYFVRYDANRTSQAVIREALVKAGYTPVNYYTDKRIAWAYFLIPSEAANDDTIESLLALDGVDDVNVNPLRKSLAVTYLNTTLTEQKLLEEIQKQGIKATLPAPHKCSEEEENKK